MAATDEKSSQQPTGTESNEGTGVGDAVDEASLKLFPERRGEKYEASFFRTAFLGHRGFKGERLKCEKMITEIVDTSPLVKLMLSALKSSGCPIDLRRNFSCEYCGPEVTGGFDPVYNQVVVCYNRCSKSLAQGVIAHELLHMWDTCRTDLDFTNVEHVACTEIRAANLMHCSFISGLGSGAISILDPIKSHQKCVKQKAVASVLAVRPNLEKREAWEVVNRVFDKCYNDLEPVGRRIRRTSNDMERAYRERHRYGYW
ncbi:Mitochondrial inner membrane protease ATP23 -like protein [Halotydeus destructor]|nr:Mitochondrial inner membrane protease ATP23 -like protein [Halotydeus destructor]